MKFSIITPTLNRREMLASAIASIAEQDGVEVQHIVVDGGSLDGTLEFLAGRPNVLVLLGPDAGVYDAINKGLRHAEGDVIGLLNADDIYAPGAFAAVRAAIEKCPTADSICGAADLFDHNGRIRQFADPRDHGLDAHAALVGFCIPNARFYRRRVFDTVGEFSLRYRLVADREFLARSLIAGMTTATIPDLVYRYRKHEGSLTFAAGATRRAEFRAELLALARNMQVHPGVNRPLLSKARALEGRCLLQDALLGLRANRRWPPMGRRNSLQIGHTAAMLRGLLDVLLTIDRR